MTDTATSPLSPAQRRAIANGRATFGDAWTPVRWAVAPGRLELLGNHVDYNGGPVLAGAIDRTVAVLREYRSVMDGLGVPAGQVRMTATSAARDAANRDAFFDAAEAAVGVRPELLSGDEEAALSFAGATADLGEHTGRGGMLYVFTLP